MMKLVQHTAALILLMLLAGCATPQDFVTVKVNYTPHLTFKPDTSPTTIVLANRVDFDKTGTTNKKKILALKDGAYSSLKYAATELQKNKNVHTVLIADSLTMKMDTDSVATIAKKYNADYVLTLDKFTAKMNLDDYAGGTAYYGIQLSLAYKLHEANSGFFKDFAAEGSEAHSEVPDGGSMIGLIFAPTLKNNHSSVNKAAQHATQTALQDYLASEVVHNRPLYDGPGGLNETAAAIKANQLTKADSLLKPLIDHVNVEIAYKAAYNMAVVYEMDGNIDDAKDMAELSIKKKPNQFAQALLTDLNEE